MTVPDYVAVQHPFWTMRDRHGLWWCVLRRGTYGRVRPYLKWEIGVYHLDGSASYYPFAEYEDVMSAWDENLEMYGEGEMVP